jgi:molybdopterin converting factor small subunit
MHELGLKYDRKWQSYLQKLADNDLKRGEGRAAGADGTVSIKLLYFIQLAKVTGRDEEGVEIPESITNVGTLLAWLRKRKDTWKESIAHDKAQVAVNKHFAESYTLVEHGDEVAIVPRSE